MNVERRMAATKHRSAGFTMIEMLTAVAITSLLVAATAGVMGEVMSIHGATTERNALARDARFAMYRMTHAVRQTRVLMLPYPDKQSTPFREHVRDQTIPPSPPETGSVFASAVLAVTQDETVDLDGDGVPDADNDGDGLIDEDLWGDITRDYAPGIIGIDDDADGWFDEVFCCWWDDDEGFFGGDEDPINGIDDDGDGWIDEDFSGDMNGDGQPGIAGVDDDGDSLIDEGGSWDDDEDGTSDEDTRDPVVFYLVGNELTERTPMPFDVDGDSDVDGRDYIESTIAENVTRFRVERVPPTAGGDQLVDLTLELTGPGSDSITLQTRVRVGGGL